jgi:hypothetical protein
VPSVQVKSGAAVFIGNGRVVERLPCTTCSYGACHGYGPDSMIMHVLLHSYACSRVQVTGGADLFIGCSAYMVKPSEKVEHTHAFNAQPLLSRLLS